MSVFYTLILILIIAIIIYFFYNRIKLLPMLKFCIVVSLLIIAASVQDDIITIPDDPDKPVMLPEIGKGLEEVGQGLGPMLGWPDPETGRDAFQEEAEWRAGLAAFFGYENVNITSNNTTGLFYA